MAAYHSARHFSFPMEFMPERWLTTASSKFSDDNKEVFQPFLYGPRNCLGKSLAYHEVRLIIASILWNFDVELENTEVDWLEQKWYGFFEKNPLRVKMTPAA
ncbi:hypothetical protein CaCOL14_008289 [Colletotrichum acutatum]